MANSYDTAVVGLGLVGAAALRQISATGRHCVGIGPTEPLEWSTHRGVFASHYDSGRITRRLDKRREWALLAARAIDAYPDDPSLTFDLGTTLADAGHDSEAERVLRDASQANPRETRAAYILGLVETRLGNVEAARAAFNRFLALAPRRYGSMRDDAQQRLASLQ